MESSLVKSMTVGHIKTTTENGMRTRITSSSRMVDLFALAGGYRKRSASEKLGLFLGAYTEHPETALMLLAHIRDVRDGMGEREFFRVCLRNLITTGRAPNLSIIPEFGRWDDLFSMVGINKDTDRIIAKLFYDNVRKDNLCAKWAPRKGPVAYTLRYLNNLSPKEYRKLCVKHTTVVETQMCNREWGGINYSSVPSVANHKYNKAFLRNDEERRRNFLSKAVKGEVKLKSSVLYPHQIIERLLVGSTNNVKEGHPISKICKWDDNAVAQWKNLPNFLEGNDSTNLLVMADTSGSMVGTPFLMSVALALYISEKNKGLFHNAFMTFTSNPDMHFCEGSNIFERLVKIIARHPANTNLERAFSKLLSVATQNKIASSEMPTSIIIISDMEFDRACVLKDSALSMIKRQYKDAGYNLPNIVFWNVKSRQDNVPVKYDKKGTALVSGASPSAIKAVLGGDINPVSALIKAINKHTYKQFAYVTE